MAYKRDVNGNIVEFSDEEMQHIYKMADLEKALTNARPLSQSEVLDILALANINSLNVDDNTAVRMIDYYPEWAVNQDVQVGYKCKYLNKLYKVIQSHTTQADWAPNIAASLFTVINPYHEGTRSDPIPYDGNMVLEDGKHYIQNEHIYYCFRDTVNPVYHPLSELVDLYVTLEI